jgi:hypothetical protein
LLVTFGGEMAKRLLAKPLKYLVGGDSLELPTSWV